MEAELGGTTIRMFGSLMIVLGMILLLFYLARKLKLRGGFRSAAIPEMRLVETLHLAPKRGLALVEFSGQWLIVGIGTENVSLIAKMDRPQTEEGDDPLRRTETPFQKLLPAGGLLRRWKKTAGAKHDEASR